MALLPYPEEVFQQIFATLERKDLKILRTTCRAFCRIASERFFESIDLRDDRYEEGDASKFQLEHIPAEPYWAHQVRSVTWIISVIIFPLLFEGLDHLKSYWQIKLLQSLPNLQQICFLRTTALVDCYQRQTKWISHYYAPNDSNCPFDLYHLLKAADLRPTILDVGCTRIHLTYNPDGSISSLTAKAVSEDARDKRHSTSYSCSSTLQRNGRGPSGWGASSDQMYPNELSLVSCLIEEHAKSLRKITLSEICVPSHFCRLLAACSRLEDLRLSDVVLVPSHSRQFGPGFTVFDLFMTAIRGRSVSSEHARPLAISFTEIGLEGHRGRLTTGDGEIMEMLKTHDPGSIPLRESFEYIPRPTFPKIRDVFPYSDSED